MENVTPTSESSTAPVLPYEPVANIMTKLTLSDKIIGGAAVVGLISMVLPALSITINFLGVTKSESAMVLKFWQGDLGLICLLGAAACSFLLLKQPLTAPANKNLLYAVLGQCGLAPLLGLWMLLGSANAGSGSGMESEFMKISVGFGTYLFLIAGLAAGFAGFLKARDAKLLPGATA